jgi:hypothetical protein
MKKSKSKTKKTLKKKKPQKPKAQSGELLNKDQELIYQGVCPAVKVLYAANTGFDKTFHPENLLEQLRNGITPSEVATSWGISLGRFNEWLEIHPELAEARAVGATAWEAFYKRALRLSAFNMLKVRENSLFKILDNQVGFTNEGGGHEFSDVSGAELVFVDPKDPKA